MIGQLIPLIIIGLLGLWFGSDITVSAARKIAHHLKVSPLFTGLVITSIGTSMPELVTSITVGINNLQVESSGIAVGNMIGSNIANITLLLGTITLFAVLHITTKSLYRDGTIMIAASVITYILYYEMDVGIGGLVLENN